MMSPEQNRQEAHMGALNLAISVALTRKATLQEMLTRCTQALTDHYESAYVGIWTVKEGQSILELQASSGLTHPFNEKHAHIPIGDVPIGHIAVERTAYLTNEIAGDPHVPEQEWVRREKIVSFIGYPLVVENQLTGVVALFNCTPVVPAILSTFEPIAYAIAVGIERQRADLVLRSSEEHFRTLANQAAVMIWQADINGEDTFLNAAWYSFTGLSEKESIGNGWTQAIHEDERGAAVAQWMQMQAAHQAYHTVLRLLRADGVYREMLVHGTPHTNHGGESLGYIGILLDITEQKDLERQREDFLSMAAHELKTPLTALQGNVQLAQRQIRKVLGEADRLQPTQQNFLALAEKMLIRCLENVKMQNRLINDLLDISRVQADKLEFHPSASDLRTLVQETIQDQQLAFPQRTLIFDAADKAPIVVLVDRERIKQVISNYVTNALKYSSAEQEVLIGVSSDTTHARVWVQDHGIGLTRAQQVHIWERFYQTQEITVSAAGSPGLGLGLYICRALIQGQGGEVGVESTKGSGSTFWFTLPIL